MKPKIILLYDNSDDRITKMAEKVLEGIKSVDNVDVEVLIANDVTRFEIFKKANGIIIGSPNEKRNVSREIDRILQTVGPTFSGKVGGTFGIRESADVLFNRMRRMGMIMIYGTVKSDIITSDDVFENCFKLGKVIAKGVQVS